jgi:hypothetical protein
MMIFKKFVVKSVFFFVMDGCTYSVRKMVVISTERGDARTW